jgi:DNA-binding NtrC family response regulator
MPGISGLELVRQIRELQPDLPCIVITGYGGAEASLEALRAGAYWYLEKPVEPAHHDVLRRLVAQAIEHGRLKTENRLLQRQLQGRYRFESLIGSSATLRRVLDVVERVADTDSTVLITGESGTGKEMVARALHWSSRRAERMFVTVNCGAIPEELLESELFGHVRGAFTNAVSHREGRFSLANGGTIFLDEIGDMSPNLQVKLLRVLQDRTFEPVGSSHSIKVDVRVIAATHQKLEQAIREKRFREDLFYRLNVIPIEVPPLRERRDDVLPLFRHFMRGAALRFQRNANERDELPAPLVEHLLAHAWPGNVRELKSAAERQVLGLPALWASDDSTVNPRASLQATLDALEALLIEDTLKRCKGHVESVCRALDVSPATLYRKLKAHGLQIEAHRDE